MKRTFFDKLIEPIAPNLALSRAKARYAINVIEEHGKRRFEGASRGPRMSGWKRPGTNADSAISGGIKVLRNSSRDLTRNNPWAAKALNVIANNTVGTGIKGSIVGRNKTQTAKLAQLWDIFVNTTMIDINGRMDLTGIQRLAIEGVAESGDVLVRKVPVRLTAKNKIPFKIQLLEPDFIDTSKSSVFNNGNYIHDGVEYDKYGTVVAYWLFDQHPGEARGANFNFESKRYSADEVKILFDARRPGQTRGYPWAAPVIRRLKDFDDYEDAQLVRQKIASAFAAFEYDMNGSDVGDTGLDKAGEEDTDQIEYFQPGTIQKLGPGRDVKFSDPPGVQNYDEYTRVSLRAISAGYGITYESLTNDYSKVNFSSGRMGWLEMHRNITRWQESIMRAQLLDTLADWFLESCFLLGYDIADAYIKWTFPRREMIDPTREVPAEIKKIRAGLTSLPRALAAMGLDVDEVIEEIKETNKKLDDAKITLDSDPRKLTAQGMEQQSESAKKEETPAEDD